MGAGVTRWYRNYLTHLDRLPVWTSGPRQDLALAWEFHLRVEVWWRLQHPVTHELKCAPYFFEPLLKGEKTFEIRRNDRGYVVGDSLMIRECTERHTLYCATGERTHGWHYTGREILMLVTYVTDYAQKPDYVVLGLQPWWPETLWQWERGFNQ